MDAVLEVDWAAFPCSEQVRRRISERPIDGRPFFRRRYLGQDLGVADAAEEAGARDGVEVAVLQLLPTDLVVRGDAAPEHPVVLTDDVARLALARETLRACGAAESFFGGGCGMHGNGAAVLEMFTASLERPCATIRAKVIFSRFAKKQNFLTACSLC